MKKRNKRDNVYAIDGSDRDKNRINGENTKTSREANREETMDASHDEDAEGSTEKSGQMGLRFVPSSGNIVQLSSALSTKGKAGSGGNDSEILLEEPDEELPFPFGQRLTKGDDPCPCGSGKQFKDCHSIENENYPGIDEGLFAPRTREKGEEQG